MAAALVALVGAGIAWAPVGGGNAVVWTCFGNNGTLKVFDKDGGEACRGTELALMGTGAKAADADKLDGMDSTDFMRGYERVIVQTEHDGSYDKSLYVTCPAGKKVLGGGYDITHGIGTIQGKIAVVNSYPIDTNEWRLDAFNSTFTGDWTLRGYALCADD